MSDEREFAALQLLRGIDEKLDRILARMDGHTERLALLDLDLSRVGDAVAELGGRMNEIVVRLARIERRLDPAGGEPKA